MKLVLLETVNNLGNVGQVVNVKSGYARNFLLPQKKAILANSESLKQVEHRKKILEKKLAQATKTAAQVKDALEKETIVIMKKAGETEKLFGSVTSLDLHKAIEEKGFVVNRKGIDLQNPIKKIGKYEISLKLDGGLETKIQLEVQAEPTEEKE